MLCKIAELFTQIPEEGDFSSLFKEYKTNEKKKADIVIDPSRYNLKSKSDEDMRKAYLRSGMRFYYDLLYFDGMMLHASAIEIDGKAYLFSGPSGVGKSTRTRILNEIFPSARIFNDDKPALRRIERKWYAYGTPWSGKNHININMKVPLAGICFVKRGDNEYMRRLPGGEAVSKLVHQTQRRFINESNVDLMLKHVERIATSIPIYELCSKPTHDATRFAYETMRHGAEEMNL